MKPVFILGIALLISACQYDPNADFDMYSPQASIAVDTFTVAAGNKLTLKATLTDASGIESYLLEYANWEIAEVGNLKESGSPANYDFEAEITVPIDAELSWTEKYQKNDGTIFDITQTYHKLSLTFYDTVHNKNIVYFYIQINP